MSAFGGKLRELRAISASAADFLAEDRASAGSLERINLAGQVLVGGRDLA
jgi:hypothetical protein